MLVLHNLATEARVIFLMVCLLSRDVIEYAPIPATIAPKAVIAALRRGFCCNPALAIFTD